MNRLLKSKRNKAFTLIELLVVIAIIALLASILVPAVQNALVRGAVTQTLSNGRSIYLSSFAKTLDNVVIQDSSVIDFPANRELEPEIGFDDSTGFFVYLVTNRVMNVPFSFFSAKGVPPAKSTDPNDFEARNNAWVLVANLTDGAPDGVPFLFTRNLNIATELSQGENDLRAQMNGGARPFGADNLVVVTKGGSGFSLQDNQITYENFNSADTNFPVLRPGAGF